MKKLMLFLPVLFLVSSCSTSHTRASTRSHFLNSGGAVTAGIPNYDNYGRPYKYVPQKGYGPGVLGPVRHNVYGPGVHSDATGKPVKAVPWP